MEPRFAETGHVLFLDLVEFSRYSAERQALLVRQLTAVVRSTPEFQRAEADGELVTLPTGDGMALVFFRYPLAPVQCAHEISQACASHPGLSLRMGIHVGAVTRVTDAAGRENLSGDGLNQAQRVMDCGDAGHVLVSSAAADTLKRFEPLRGALRDLGEFVVKHGERLRIFNLVTETLGRDAVPSRLRQWSSSPEPHLASPAAGGRTVALLCEQASGDAEELRDLLKTRLQSAGYTVFCDQDLPVSVEWARELQHQVRHAYAVVPFLSEESIQSEILEGEVLAALEAQQQRGGLPRIIGVWMDYAGALPEPLHYALGGQHAVTWKGPQDSERAAAELVRGLSGPSSAPPLEAVGGAVPLDSRFYIMRASDHQFAASISRRDSIVLVKGARQMGKTSLLTRGLQQAREAGARCFRTDLQKLTTADLQNEHEFFLALAEMIADQLDLEVEPEAFWNPRRGGPHNFERFMRRGVLASAMPHVWALDEVDRLFSCPFGTDVFALFRSWHNDRAYEPGGPWSYLTMAIAYATEAHLFITDVNQSPFNVGTRLTLEDFTVAEVGELNARYGSPLDDGALVQRFHALVGGQPYLCRKGLDYLTQHPGSYPELERTADQDEGIFGDHLRRLLVTITQDLETHNAVLGILSGERSLDPNVFYRLRSGGLLSGGSHREFRLRCDLYERYLCRHLL